MRQPSILDVVRAVKEVARAHPEIAAWWYVPPRRLRLDGEPMDSAQRAPSVEVILEAASAPSHECDAIARELSAKIGPVSVRSYRGASEERRLFRLMSRGGVPSPGGQLA